MAKSIYDIFGTDKEREKSGIDVDYGDGIIFRVARLGGANSAYTRYVAAQLKRYKHQIDTDTLPADKAREILVDAFVKHVLLGWENIFGENGVAIAFSEENAKKLFRDMPDLYNDLAAVATDFANFQTKYREETAKNSASA